MAPAKIFVGKGEAVRFALNAFSDIPVVPSSCA
jgi:hypothetical protein